jgi:hypothetical protein
MPFLLHQVPQRRAEWLGATVLHRAFAPVGGLEETLDHVVDRKLQFVLGRLSDDAVQQVVERLQLKRRVAVHSHQLPRDGPSRQAPSRINDPLRRNQVPDFCDAYFRTRPQRTHDFLTAFPNGTRVSCANDLASIEPLGLAIQLCVEEQRASQVNVPPRALDRRGSSPRYSGRHVPGFWASDFRFCRATPKPAREPTPLPVPAAVVAGAVERPPPTPLNPPNNATTKTMRMIVPSDIEISRQSIHRKAPGGFGDPRSCARDVISVFDVEACED